MATMTRRVGPADRGLRMTLDEFIEALRRAGDVWEVVNVPAGGTYRTHLLPGLEVRVDEWLGPADEL